MDFNKIPEKSGVYKIYNQASKGKTFEEIYGEERAKELKENLSNIAKKKIGNKNPFYGKQHKEEVKKAISEKMKGRKPPNRKRVEINGIQFDSLSDASKELNIPSPTIHWRINKGIEGYKYL